MDFELAFSMVSVSAMFGWLILFAYPVMPVWSDRLSGVLIPLFLSLAYAVMLVFSYENSEGGFDSLSGVLKLFSSPSAMLAGWIHFLAFDLFIGAWQCRTARVEGIPFWFVLPCLALTFFLGPLGLLLFFALRRLSARYA